MNGKTDRFERAVTALFVVTALAICPPAHGRKINLSASLGPIKINIKSNGRRSQVAGALAKEVGQVQGRFDQGRAALPLLKGKGGAPAYPRKAVDDLFAATERDLDRGIGQIPEPGLAALRAWASARFQRLRGALGPAADARAAVFPSAPPTIALAALRQNSLPRILWAKTAPPPPSPVATVDAKLAAGVLDQVGELIGRILFLSQKDDLEVKLWVGTTSPKPATFRFWPQASAGGGAPAEATIQTNGKLSHVVRGLYSYSAAFPDGAVTEYIKNGRASGVAGPESEDLDLVNGSGFFCCRFEEKYCHQVGSEKECRVEKR